MRVNTSVFTKTLQNVYKFQHWWFFKIWLNINRGQSTLLHTPHQATYSGIIVTTFTTNNLIVSNSSQPKLSTTPNKVQWSLYRQNDFTLFRFQLPREWYTHHHDKRREAVANFLSKKIILGIMSDNVLESKRQHDTRRYELIEDHTLVHTMLLTSLPCLLLPCFQYYRIHCHFSVNITNVIVLHENDLRSFISYHYLTSLWLHRDSIGLDARHIA